MPRRAGETHLDIQNITHEQMAAIKALAKKTGESQSALAKRLFAEEAKRQGIEWPDDDVRGWNPQS
jgi:glycine cleavage system protein P-like pyridoxal-binding family